MDSKSPTSRCSENRERIGRESTVHKGPTRSFLGALALRKVSQA